ncbi:unnamed protein product [Amoebophrya sp. A120]|nr:unnamed protein product [Amoebophrya sp. A120]CAD7975201.1 unnamed protein product [Amoebophrya sp. A120]|eukprot:GSA120T00000090001.1
MPEVMILQSSGRGSMRSEPEEHNGDSDAKNPSSSIGDREDETSRITSAMKAPPSSERLLEALYYSYIHGLVLAGGKTNAAFELWDAMRCQDFLSSPRSAAVLLQAYAGEVRYYRGVRKTGTSNQRSSGANSSRTNTSFQLIGEEAAAATPTTTREDEISSASAAPEISRAIRVFCATVGLDNPEEEDVGIDSANTHQGRGHFSRRSTNCSPLTLWLNTTLSMSLPTLRINENHLSLLEHLFSVLSAEKMLLKPLVCCYLRFVQIAGASCRNSDRSLSGRSRTRRTCASSNEVASGRDSTSRAPHAQKAFDVDCKIATRDLLPALARHCEQQQASTTSSGSKNSCEDLQQMAMKLWRLVRGVRMKENTQQRQKDFLAHKKEAHDYMGPSLDSLRPVPPAAISPMVTSLAFAVSCLVRCFQQQKLEIMKTNHDFLQPFGKNNTAQDDNDNADALERNLRKFWQYAREAVAKDLSDFDNSFQILKQRDEMRRAENERQTDDAPLRHFAASAARQARTRLREGREDKDNPRTESGFLGSSGREKGGAEISKIDHLRDEELQVSDILLSCTSADGTMWSSSPSRRNKSKTDVVERSLSSTRSASSLFSSPKQATLYASVWAGGGSGTTTTPVISTRCPVLEDEGRGTTVDNFSRAVARDDLFQHRYKNYPHDGFAFSPHTSSQDHSIPRPDELRDQLQTVIFGISSLTNSLLSHYVQMQQIEDGLELLLTWTKSGDCVSTFFSCTTGKNDSGWTTIGKEAANSSCRLREKDEKKDENRIPPSCTTSNVVKIPPSLFSYLCFFRYFQKNEMLRRFQQLWDLATKFSTTFDDLAELRKLLQRKVQEMEEAAMIPNGTDTLGRNHKHVAHGELQKTSNPSEQQQGPQLRDLKKASQRIDRLFHEIRALALDVGEFDAVFCREVKARFDNLG